MIRHVVMWKFKPGTREEMEQFLTGLQGLYSVCPPIMDFDIISYKL